ncbi:hypothetical protein [Burkholderia perseverans]|nr:hypothetical protein [Burkholderia perseverans]
MISLNALIPMGKAVMLRRRMKISHYGLRFHHVDFLVLPGAGSYNWIH